MDATLIICTVLTGMLKPDMVIRELVKCGVFVKQYAYDTQARTMTVFGETAVDYETPLVIELNSELGYLNKRLLAVGAKSIRLSASTEENFAEFSEENGYVFGKWEDIPL
jgi:hypothetical protein